MKYRSWDKADSIERSFLKALNKISRMFGDIAKRAMTPNEFQEMMDEFQESEEYGNYITSSVRNMVTPIATMNMRTWRQAAKKASKSPMLYKLLLREINSCLEKDIREQIESNSLLIKTLPHDTALKVVNDIEKLTYKGLRASEIQKHIRKYTDQHARVSAKLIARTEVSKTMSALTQARAKNLNINWYVWRTEQDGDRVRPSHRTMEGVLVNFDYPPSPERLTGLPSVGNYHAGNIWNCRCYEEPLLDVDDVKWPHKVHINGQIKTMSRKEFELLL